MVFGYEKRRYVKCDKKVCFIKGFDEKSFDEIHTDFKHLCTDIINSDNRNISVECKKYGCFTKYIFTSSGGDLFKVGFGKDGWRDGLACNKFAISIYNNDSENKRFINIDLIFLDTFGIGSFDIYDENSFNDYENHKNNLWVEYFKWDEDKD